MCDQLVLSHTKTHLLTGQSNVEIQFHVGFQSNRVKIVFSEDEKQEREE